MPLVNVLINGHAYTVACDEGEEPRLRELGAFVDKRVREMVQTIGTAVGETRLILMAGLMIADELSEALAKLEERDREIATLRATTSHAEASLRDTEETLAEALEAAAQQIEDIAARIAPA
jgi:cell division protein ZapA